MSDFDFNAIDEAYKRINDQVLRTPLVTSEYINNLLNAQVYFKLENLQWTGSFKLRGAINKIMQLNVDQRKNGVVAYSSGNHAQAVAYASNLNGISSTIIMPKNAPTIKINNTKKYGAKVILYDPLIESREEIANKISENQGRTLIKPYEDFDIMAGQGTSGKEIAEEMIRLKLFPDLYLCCCGGGGLIAGTSTYLKYEFPNIDCYAVEPEEFNEQKFLYDLNKLATTFYREPLVSKEKDWNQKEQFHHIGIYGYTKKLLNNFCSLPVSKLENSLKLEQLRALENNILLTVLNYKGEVYRGIDTPEDLVIIRKHLENN